LRDPLRGLTPYEAAGLMFIFGSAILMALVVGCIAIVASG
jgi:hypothetical protein